MASSTPPFLSPYKSSWFCKVEFY